MSQKYNPPYQAYNVPNAMDYMAKNNVLFNAMQQYLRTGWVVQSQGQATAQLYKRNERGCLGKLIFGLWDLVFKRQAEIVTLEVDDFGHIHTIWGQAHV